MPSLVSGIISPGSNVRGGGEYALVQQSWNSVQQSVSYFKDVYAQNAFRAFRLKNTEEVGSEVCRAFIGTSVPASADLLDSLLEPESPTQFYAQFSERLFSEATVPSTSQYKVYYHIYAGNDKGVQYRIYLKNPPASSYYASNPSVWVDSGYIAKGASADESVDFTAPSGYKELCVVIDAKEECGFKSVTTDFGLDYVKDKYVQEQAEKSDITSEGECISGSPSALSAVNLNLQSGAEEIVSPNIALRGIVRVCASSDPGQGVNSRWKDVGHCGDSTMRCWLDVDSVKNDLGRVEAIENTSLSVLDERRGLIENTQMTLEQVRASLSSLRVRVKGLGVDDLKEPEGGKVAEIVGELARIVSIDGDALAGTNADRAEALALRATVYRMVTMVKRVDASVVVKGEPVSSSEIEGLELSKEGEECFSVKDCEDGLSCEFEEVSGMDICVRVGVKREGEECLGNDECVSGLSCEFDEVSNMDVCVEEVVAVIIYVVRQPGLITPLYFRYVDEWEWSPDEENWMDTSVTVVSGGDYDKQKPVVDNIQIIINLDGKGLSDGLEVIRSGSVGVSEK